MLLLNLIFTSFNYLATDMECKDTIEEENIDFATYMPWIKTVVQISSASNFLCLHDKFCHPDCFERQRRSCLRFPYLPYKD